MFANLKAIAFILTLIAGSIYSFVVPSTGAMSPAVYKTSMIFGYDVTGIIFEQNEIDPAAIDTITFHIAPGFGSAEANHVKIQTKVGGPWTECSLVEDALPVKVATCTFESLAMEDVTALKIVAR